MVFRSRAGQRAGELLERESLKHTRELTDRGRALLDRLDVLLRPGRMHPIAVVSVEAQLGVVLGQLDVVVKGAETAAQLHEPAAAGTFSSAAGAPSSDRPQ